MIDTKLYGYEIKSNNLKEIASVTYQSFNQSTKQVCIVNLTGNLFSQKLRRTLKKKYKLYAPREYSNIYVSFTEMQCFLNNETYRNFLHIVDELIKLWYESEIA